MIKKRPSREIQIGSAIIGADQPIAVQSMTATKTTDIERTAKTCQVLADAGAAIVRIAVDTPRDAEALERIRLRTDANLSVDLQENYRLAERVAPFVDKIRYNPGHLHHVEPNIHWKEKVRYIVDVAEKNNVALRIGVNCGSLDPAATGEDPMIQSACEHAQWIESLGFKRFCVSIKSSDPETVVWANKRFAQLMPEIPLHLGVTEAGMPPDGINKTRAALEPLLAEGIGDTIRVSLTVPNEQKIEEIEAGQFIIENVQKNAIFNPRDFVTTPLNIVSCPSCARVENDRFVLLAQQVREATRPFQNKAITIAVMGCRVNGPGETDHADLGLWCGPNFVNLKKRETLLGSFTYEEIVARLLEEIQQLN